MSNIIDFSEKKLELAIKNAVVLSPVEYEWLNMAGWDGNKDTISDYMQDYPGDAIAEMIVDDYWNDKELFPEPSNDN